MGNTCHCRLSSTGITLKGRDFCLALGQLESRLLASRSQRDVLQSTNTEFSFYYHPFQGDGEGFPANQPQYSYPPYPAPLCCRWWRCPGRPTAPTTSWPRPMSQWRGAVVVAMGGRDLVSQQPLQCVRWDNLDKKLFVIKEFYNKSQKDISEN